MANLKYDVRASDPDKALAGGGEQAPVGMYPAKIVSCVYEEPDDKTPRIVVQYQITNGDYAILYDYITMAETQVWKLDQFLQAVGVATKGKRTGSWDPEKQKGKKVKIRVRGETYNEEYRGKANGVWKDDGTGYAAGEEQTEDEAAADEDGGVTDERWLEIIGLSEEDVESDEETQNDILTYGAEWVPDVDADEVSWTDYIEAINDAMNAGDEEGGEEGEPDEEGGDDSGEEEVPYSEWTLAELKEELAARELPAGGTKNAMVKRLEGNDEEGPFDE